MQERGYDRKRDLVPIEKLHSNTEIGHGHLQYSKARKAQTGKAKKLPPLPQNISSLVTETLLHHRPPPPKSGALAEQTSTRPSSMSSTTSQPLAKRHFLAADQMGWLHPFDKVGPTPDRLNALRSDAFRDLAWWRLPEKQPPYSEYWAKFFQKHIAKPLSVRRDFEKAPYRALSSPFTRSAMPGLVSRRRRPLHELAACSYLPALLGSQNFRQHASTNTVPMPTMSDNRRDSAS